MKNSIIYLSFVLVALFSNAVVASNGMPDPVKVLKATPKITGMYGKEGKAAPLAVAIVKGDIETVRKFISYGMDINEKSNDMTPLMIAARYNQLDIIKLLLENGAKVKTANSKGITALKYAQLSNAKEAAELLTTTVSQ